MNKQEIIKQAYIDLIGIEEYEKYKVQMINEKSKVQIDFEKVVASLGDKK